MPRATVTKGEEYTLPAEVLFTGRLLSVNERKQEFTYKAHHKAVQNGKKKAGEKGEIIRWVWTFQVLNDGEYYGKEATIETEPGVTTRADDKVREFYEVLLGRELTIGEDIDTDSQVVGLPCRFTVRHLEPREASDGSGRLFYDCPVDQVYPPDNEAPPF